MVKTFLVSLLLCAVLGISGVRAQSDDVIRLTLEQKVGQMFMVGLFGTVPTDLGRELVTRYQPGGMVIFDYNVSTPESITALVNTYQQTILDAGSLPMFVGVDQEGGRIQTLEGVDGFTDFPVPQLAAASGDPRVAQDYAAAIAAEIAAVGINLNFAPVLDLETNLLNPVLYRRMLGSDPELVGTMGAGIIQGTQQSGVLAVAKHFPGHGDTSEDSHTTLPTIAVERDTLDARELVPFRAAIEAGVAGIMVGHVYYPALESQPDTPASLSYGVVTRLLREDLGYQGLILTDALDMDAIDTTYSPGAAAVQAVLAGVDILVLGPHMPLSDQQAAIQAVIDAVNSGTIPESRIDESLQRILEAKIRFGILDWQPLDSDTARERIDLSDHADLVQTLFERGITIAQDEGDLLPLNLNNPLLIVFPGTRQQIGRSCDRREAEDLRWASINPSPTDEEISAIRQTAERIAQENGTIVAFVEDAYNNAAQTALVRALPPDRTVVVSLFSAHDWLPFPDVSSFVTTYSPINPVVPVVCGMLYGESPAQGVLPLTLNP